MRSAAGDAAFMKRCIGLARLGGGSVAPNPLVGCVIVKNGRVLAEGFHRKFGSLHAERDAFRNLKRSARGATLYVNLEPCSHYGKTPPCVDAIVENGIRRVVIGTLDPNPLVSGGGSTILREAGIDLTIGVCEDECRELNKFFLKHVGTGRPYVLVKIAQSLDGYIASPLHRGSITTEQSRKLVHRWRAQYDAVLVGAGTVNADDPSLTVRLVRGRQPKRIIVDGNLSCSHAARVFNDRYAGSTYLIVDERTLRSRPRKRSIFQKKGITLVAVRGKRKGRVDFGEIFRALGLLGISSVLVEGGAEVFRQVVHQHHADEIAVFVSPVMFHTGTPVFGAHRSVDRYVPVQMESPDVTPVGRDILLRGKLKKDERYVYRHR